MLILVFWGDINSQMRGPRSLWGSCVSVVNYLVKTRRFSFVLGSITTVALGLYTGKLYLASSDATSSRRQRETRIESLRNFCKSIPKVELHAHLNGSVRVSTIADICRQRNMAGPKPVKLGGRRGLTECFEIFDLIHKVW